MRKVVGIVASAAGGLEQLRGSLVTPLLDRGFQVPVTLTPTAAVWMEEAGEVDNLTALTGFPVRSRARLPSESRPHPRADVLVLAPATANAVAKLALGIADNQAMALLCENLGTTRTVVFPRVNAAHARYPAWSQHLTTLRQAGVDLIYGDDVWPLHEPRTTASRREPPWQQIIARC